jgi:hypothetical protein
VASTGIAVRFLFAYLILSTSSAGVQARNYFSWETRLIPRWLGSAIVRGNSARVNPSICASLCTASEILQDFLAPEKVEASAAADASHRKLF